MGIYYEPMQIAEEMCIHGRISENHTDLILLLSPLDHTHLATSPEAVSVRISSLED